MSREAQLGDSACSAYGECFLLLLFEGRAPGVAQIGQDGLGFMQGRGIFVLLGGQESVLDKHVKALEVGAEFGILLVVQGGLQLLDNVEHATHVGQGFERLLSLIGQDGLPAVADGPIVEHQQDLTAIRGQHLRL